MKTRRTAKAARTDGKSAPHRVIKYQRPWVYPKQYAAVFDPRDCTGAPARFSLIEASTKSGKTVSCIFWIVEQALVGGGPGRNFWWVAPIRSQAKIAFDRFKIFARNMPWAFETNETDLVVFFINGARIWFKSADNPDSLYGEDVWAVVVDEASRMKELAWTAIYSTLTATKGGARIIGNVKGRKNWFFNWARRAEKGEPRLSYHKITANDAVASGILDKLIIEGAKRDLPEAVFKELYMAEPSDDEGNPFGFKAIEACVGPLSTDKPAAWGWDLAKKKNWTVGIGLDYKGRTSQFERFQQPWPDTIDRIHRCVSFRPALIDSTGVGDPVLDQLQRNGGGSNYEGYNFTQPSKQRLMEGLAVGIQSQKISYPDGPIRMELDSIEYEYTRTGVRYSAPEGADDDCVMALALAYHKLTTRGNITVMERLGRM